MFKISSFRRPVLVLVLGLLLSSAASAAPSPWAGLLKLLPQLGWGDLGEKRGCSVDPDGQPWCPKTRRQPHHRTTTVSPKHGCSVDPNGQMVCEP